MGEIGIPRHEFLYEICFWETTRIIRGYRRRDRLKLQLLAQCCYASTFSMRDPKGKTAADIFPDLFPEEGEEAEIMDEDDQQEILDMIHAINSRQSTDK